MSAVSDIYHAIAPNGQKACLQLEGKLLENQKFDNNLRQHLGEKGVRLVAGPCDKFGFKSQYQGFHKEEHGISVTVWIN